MKLLLNFIYLLKYSLLGGAAGFAILFFIPDSPVSFNWREVQNVWIFYKNNHQQTEKASAETFNQPQISSYAKAIEKAGPSVVSVQARRKGRVRPAIDGKKGDMLVDISVGVGSGVIFDKEGYIVTNYHVIAGSYSIAVHFSSGLRKYAKVVGFDKQDDIAVLKVDIPTPMVAELGNSSELKTGDVVMAIGTPLGLFANSVTQGIVSAIDHGPLDHKIQTDAAINYGISGGALINSKGQVIGISRAKFSVEKNDEIGINFATPIDFVKESFNQIVKNGRVARNWLGIGLNQLNKAGYDYVDPGIAFGNGLLVSAIEKGSPGSESGLKVRDFLTRFDGIPVENMVQFRKLFIAIPIGKEVEIEVMRDKKLLKLQLKLREKNIG